MFLEDVCQIMRGLAFFCLNSIWEKNNGTMQNNWEVRQYFIDVKGYRNEVNKFGHPSTKAIRYNDH